MEVEAVALTERGPRPLPAQGAPCAAWPAAVLAQALSHLLGRPVTADEVRDRAVGLGLLRQPLPAGPVELTPRAAARLLLAGYGLPALVEAGNAVSLDEHSRAGRRVLVVLARPEVGSFEIAELCSGQADGIAAAWEAAGRATLVAARAWADLPTEGLLFFGGLRDADSAYHWNTAECDTDRQGRILRY